MEKNQRKISRKQEEKVAKFLGGKTQPNSGATWHSKLDVSSKDFLVECKFTKGKQFTIDYDKLQTWLNQARNIGKVLLVFYEFLQRKEFVLMEKEFFEDLLKCYQTSQEDSEKH